MPKLTHPTRAYESGTRQPPLIALLQYARATGVPVEVLIDDEQELPENLPVGTTTWIMKQGQLRQQRR
jgi:hypothetical protein